MWIGAVIKNSRSHLALELDLCGQISQVILFHSVERSSVDKTDLDFVLELDLILQLDHELKNDLVLKFDPRSQISFETVFGSVDRGSYQECTISS